MKGLLGGDAGIGSLEALGLVRGVGLVVGGETLVVAVRGRDGIRGVHEFVVAAVGAGGTFGVLVAVPAAREAPHHLMPFPPSNHHGDDHGHDGDDDAGDFSRRQIVVVIATVFGAVGVGWIACGLGGI